MDALADGVLLDDVPFMMPTAVAGFGVTLASGLLSKASLDLAPLLVGASMFRGADVCGVGVVVAEAERRREVAGSVATCEYGGDYCIHDVSAMSYRRDNVWLELPVVLNSTGKRRRPYVCFVQQMRAVAKGWLGAGGQVC